MYGGGGIEPDKFIVGSDRRVQSDALRPARSCARQTFATFADQFIAEGDTRMSAANKNQKRIARGFTVTDAMVADFKALLKPQKVKIDEPSFAKDDGFIRAMIHYEIDSALFGVDEARRNLIAKDPQAQFALGAVSGGRVRLTELARARVTAKRAETGRAFGPIFWGCTLVLPQVIGAC